MNPSPVVSIPNGTSALTQGMRVGLALQNVGWQTGVVVTVPAGTALTAIGTVVRDVAAGAVAVAGTVANNLGQFSTTDVFLTGRLAWGQADGAISAGAAVYPQAGGLITATNTGTQIGIALQAALQAGDVIQFITTPFI